jgi:hypothetical protein
MRKAWRCHHLSVLATVGALALGTAAATSLTASVRAGAAGRSGIGAPPLRPLWKDQA